MSENWNDGYCIDARALAGLSGCCFPDPVLAVLAAVQQGAYGENPRDVLDLPTEGEL